ncbi:hypothetical protein Hbl1158_07360 [Halobaculum sp. CBA1158]|uniref:DUF7310 family coiled-coil domain-containing protein n=1 Tax=Halobaculum sp. CBA1158 TaxID=2904243 RepID=UPI001F1EA9DC|nr:hypothetical protein [Halobaculum sp. CBA1158]UIP01156.1 hypothetical protein Hbl1158_07360 [Halobaculum sp. CBA1158]
MAPRDSERSDDNDANAADIHARVDAIERAVCGDAGDLTDLSRATEATARLDEVEGRLDAAEDTVADLEAAVEAIRGYVGAIRAVNERVERRADRALAATERLREDAAVNDPTASDAVGGAVSDAALEDARDDPESHPWATTADGSGPTDPGSLDPGPSDQSASSVSPSDDEAESGATGGSLADRLRDAL